MRKDMMIEMDTFPPLKDASLYSPGGFAFFKNEKVLILTKKGNTALINNEVFKSLQKQVIPLKEKTYFLQRGILQPDCHINIDKPVTYFIIDIVKKCNFNCIYCFRDLQDKRIISIEMLDKILYFIRQYCEENRLYRIGLQMWGGEPLLSMDRIEYVVKYFENSSITAVIDIETNGSLINDETAKKLHVLGIQMGISLDGTPVFQNKQRPFVNGLPSSAHVEEGINNLQKYYHDAIGGITVVTKYNFKHIKEILDYYIYHLHLKSFKFNLVRDNPNAVAGGLALDIDEVTWFANELFDYLYAFYSMGRGLHEGNIDVRVRNLLYQCDDNLCLSHGCQGGKRIISFNQSGSIFPCEMTDFEDEKIGSIFSGHSLNDMIKNAKKNNKFFIPKESEKCKTCPWWCYCRGGCTSRNRYMGLVGKPDECECALNRVIYPKIIEGILDGIIGG